MKDQVKQLADSVDDQVAELQRRTKQQLNGQDDAIDQLSRELHRGAKKKSDLQLDLDELKA